MFNVEGRETHICIYCWAVGLRETKPINFGSHKAEGNETNTVLGYWGGGSLEEGHFWVFKVEGRETHILLGQGAEGNETHKFWESQS